MHDIVKEMFAQEFASMLKEMPLEKIRVTDLSRRCEVSPQTFYYHFCDKYDLIAWMFLKDLSETDFTSSQTHIVSFLSRMWDRRAFYAPLLNQRSQNSLTDYLTNFYTHLAPSPLSTEQNLALWYDVYGFMGLLTKWLKGELAATSEESASFLNRVTPPFLLNEYTEKTPILLASITKNNRQKYTCTPAQMSRP